MCPVVCDSSLEQTRSEADRCSHQRIINQQTRALSLIALCTRARLRWHHVPPDIQRHVCRTFDTADEHAPTRGWRALAAALGVQVLDVDWYKQQTAGQLCGPTELMLADLHLHDSRGSRFAVSRLLEFLVEHRHWRCLGQIDEPVRCVCATRLNRRESTDEDETESAVSSCESGFDSVLSSSDLLDDRVATNGKMATHNRRISGTVASDRRTVSESMLLTALPPPAEFASQESINSRSGGDGAPLSPIVLLTYAQDGRSAALWAADRLKNGDQYRPSCRVLLLEEQRRWTSVDRHSAIVRWFEEVDYVVAVLTPDYLAATQNTQSSVGSFLPARLASASSSASSVSLLTRSTSTESRGSLIASGICERQRRGNVSQQELFRQKNLAADARFVYTLMCSRLEKYGHVNWWFRALVPDELVGQLDQHPLYGSTVFRWPVPLSCIDELTECLVF